MHDLVSRNRDVEGLFQVSLGGNSSYSVFLAKSLGFRKLLAFGNALKIQSLARTQTRPVCFPNRCLSPLNNPFAKWESSERLLNHDCLLVSACLSLLEEACIFEVVCPCSVTE